MNEITETMSRAELIAWIEAMQKKNNDLWAKAIVREKAKKKPRKTE
jgi:hypothetical protein